MMRHSQQEHRPESSRQNEAFRAPKYSKRGPVSILILLLVSVYMCVTNVRHTLEMLPQTFDPFLDHLETFATYKRPEHSTEIIKEGHVRTRDADDTFVDNQDNQISGTRAETAKDIEKYDRKPKIHIANQTLLSDKMPDALSKSVSDLPELLSVVPTDNNTVISLVSMGGLVNTFTVERCIRSIRQRGMFTGCIMLFTDSEGYRHYQETIPFVDNRTMVIQGRDEDLHPRELIQDGKNQSEAPLKKYAQKSMIFKRFKTHHSKYIRGYPALADSIRFVVYVDADNIIGRKMDIFFKDYAKMVADRYPKAIAFHRNFTLTASVEKSKGDAFGFMSMFRDRHLKSKMHSGILVYDRAFEEQCVNGWRNEMDTFWDSSDQQMFLRVLGDYDRYRCTVFDLPATHMNFANKRIMRDAMEERLGLRKKRRPLEFPTFIHVTQYRVRRLNNATIHSEFLRHLLQLTTNEPMTESISWEDAVSAPSANRTTAKR